MREVPGPDGEMISKREAFERALTEDTTIARVEIGLTVIHADWTGDAAWPFAVHVWEGDDWVHRIWCRTRESALAAFEREVEMVKQAV